MSDPILIVVGATLLFLIALVVFVVTLVRTLRRNRRLRWEESGLSDAVPSSESGPVITSLEGLEVEVADDAPSASLLTPLRTGEWRPPDEPAPLDSLQSASLADRIAEFTPAPDIADPPFSIPQPAPWQMLEPAAMSPVPMADNNPSPKDTDSDAELDAEIAALITPEPYGAVEPTEPPFEPVAAQDVAPEPPPAPVPVVVPTAPLPISVEVPDASDEAEYWNTVLAEQSRETARAIAPGPPAVPRPEVKIAAPLAVEPTPPVPEPLAPEPHAPRPRVRVHVAPAQEEASTEPRTAEAGLIMVTNAQMQERNSVNPNLEMAAPVEMWFGDSRVGVKAGTATYDRFRKYADVLLDELRASTVSHR